MKNSVFRYHDSPAFRAFSAFLALVIVLVGLPFVGVETNAETLSQGDGYITSTSIVSKYMGFTVDGNNYTTSTDESVYKYTGRLETVSVDMYDYLTDGEISASNANWNNINDSNYTWHSFYNPYNTFDKAISDTNAFTARTIVSSPHENNVTIHYHTNIDHFSSPDNVYVHIFESDTKKTTWPGLKMTNLGNGDYIYTFALDNLGFTPSNFIFNGGDSSTQSSTFTPTSVEPDNTYYFDDTTVTINCTITSAHKTLSNDVYMYVWGESPYSGKLADWPGVKMEEQSDGSYSYTYSTTSYATSNSLNKYNKIIFNGGYNPNTTTVYWQTPDKHAYNNADTSEQRLLKAPHIYTYNEENEDSGNAASGFEKVSSVTSSSPAQDITTTHYLNPLYFGMFLMPGESYTSETKPDTTSNANTSYSTSNHYNNFWWQANMAQRSSTSSSVQGLVDKNLTVNPVTKERKLMQEGAELPYFSKDWADSHKSSGNDIMRYWESSEASKISFPFYEVLTDPSNAKEYVKGTNDTSVTAEKALFHQFNSKDSTVYFDAANTQFIEKNPTTERIRDTEGNSAFLPFNNVDSYDQSDAKLRGKNNNYGFGAKFHMTFKLNPDGKVATVKENGDPLEGAGRVNTRFEFTGDDDLWVFIDDHLVLDMGGDHGASSGYIDFCKQEAEATTAITLGEGSGKDDLTRTGTPKKVEPDEFVKLIKGYTSSKGYDDTVHTMTIFYMERGMSQSNLKIRYNFAVEANFSKMKIKEQTDFSNVNAGLKNLTQKAAENDVFKYTVMNQGTDKDNVLQTNTKYPTKANNVRTVQGINTKLTSSTSGTPASSYFMPENKTINYPVGNVSYNWVDEYAGMKSKVGAGGITDSEGHFYLLHGTPKDGSTPEVKSSAEFEGQFDRYSLMQISQANQLYKPNEHKNGDSDNAASLSTEYTGRSVDTYYTTNRTIFSTIKTTPVSIDDNVQFAFRNDINPLNLTLGNTTPDENTASTVQMTELFVNTVKTNTLTITKNKTGLTTNSQDTDYSFKLTLNDLFGNTVDSYADLSDADYTGIVVTKSGETGTSTLGSGGTFTLKANQTITITGIPYGTKFTLTEQDTNIGSGTNYNNTTISGTIGETTTTQTDNSITLTITADATVGVSNKFNDSLDVNVKKTDTSGNGLPGAELELWYKETTTPDTYSFNNPQIVPNKVNGMKVSKSASDVGIPGLQESVSTYYTYSSTNTYENPTVPSSSDTDWILPRNDTDYIYFRDYNTGTYTGEWDNTSFTKSSDDSNNDNGTEKRTWRETNFAKKTAATSSDPGTHNQTLELGFTNGNQWFAAEFSGTGKKTVKYAMWERFVDEYNNEKTAVWKIQPPDGYTTVCFMLMEGDTCIRKTLPITYELGKIYHKTSWGGYWTSKDGKNCYYDVPYDDEGYWAPHDDTAQAGGIYDQRNTDSTMLQARKYIPTERKIIFHCNSDDVWHNIHIEFFSDTTGTTRVEGQAFPGYMMEPYAYAGNDYRTDDGYLTYELTIPKGAKSFRITNGESTTEIYGYYTAVTQLLNQTAKKNYGNYFHFKTYNQKGGILEQWTTPPEEGNTTGIPDHTYTTTDITSDCDYIYFEKPSSDWGNNVYAYFYGGGNLRDDNWQRACYSSWPGIAPVGTEYDSVYSNTYSISTSGNKYNGTDVTTSTISPESYYTSSGKRIYKFRLPKGDAKNYSKVIFNDGLSGGHETGVIAYKAGCIYDKSGNETKHYDEIPTEIYLVRSNNSYSSDDKTEYIYIKNRRNWDDLHITFSDSDGNQILQGGCGYVMDYAGKMSDVEYYRMPIPENAAKFSVNNGIGNTPTEKYDITRLSETDAKPTNTKSAEDMFVYDFATDTTLTRVGYTEGTPTRVSVTTTTGQTESTSDYTSGIRKTGTTDDTLNIRDDFAWDVPIGGVNVTFYGSTGTVVGSGVMMKTNADSDGKVWYTKKIPSGAESFSVSYTKVVSSTPTTTTTANYPIYKAATPDTNGNVTTSGNMYYKTAGDNKLSVIYTESTYNEADDETYQQRGDYLYLKCLTSEKNTYWKDMKVTFYANGDNIIRSDVTAKFINYDTDGVNSWYRVSIPTGAETFTVTGTKVSDSTTHTTDRADIYELKSKYSRYEENYTLGNMQYELPSSSGGSAAALLYPKFTKDDEYTLEVSTGNIISSAGSIVPVDTSAVSGYAAASVATAEKSSSVPVPQQALYETDKNTVSYTWTNSSANDDMLRFVKPDGWSAPSAQFYKGDTVVGSKTAMTVDTAPTYKVAVPTSDYDSVIFSDSTNSSPKISLTSYDGGKNYVCSYGGTTTGEFTDGKVRFNNSTTNWSNVYVSFWNGSDTGSGTWYQMSSEGNNVYSYSVPDGTYNYVRFSSAANGNASTPQTRALSESNGGRNKIFNPSIDTSNIYFRVASAIWSEWNQKIYAYFYNSGSDEYATFGTVGGSDGCPEHKNDATQEIHFELGNVNAKKSYNYLIVYGWSNGTKKWQTVSIDISGTPSNGGGRTYQINNTGGRPNTEQTVDFKGYGSTYSDCGSWSSTGTTSIWTLTPVSGSSLTATYQPEDRYGMISSLNSGYDPVTDGTADTDNFIYINTELSDPYIMFYSDTTGAGANKIGGSGMADTGISLKQATLDGSGVATVTGTANLYRIRLPKNAQSFKVANGASGTQSAAQALNVTNYSVTYSTGTETQSTTLPSFRHAGTTFAVSTAATPVITVSSLRSGLTATKQPITDPLNPRTDGDYIFFTDTGNTFGGSGETKTVYAYYYGGADGEYTAWPGIKASTDDTAPLVYTDNEGRRVYMFQLPELSNGKYPYVIFNNGSANSRKVTQAISIMNSTQTAYTAGGNNYILDTAGTDNQHYGTYDSTENSTNYVTAYPTGSQSKIISAAADYSTGGTGRYIYIINNGTTTNTAGTDRTVFDDMHIMFYDAEKYPIGSYTPGYKPDKLSSQTYTATGEEATANGTAGNGDIYRIQVPSNAVYFQINNGTKAGTTNDNERQSEIKAITANALYRFVPKATNANDYISETNVPTKQSDAHFLLDIVNRITTSEEENSESSTVDIHIATVVTGANGTIDHIKWLKNSMTDIDSTYLANTDGSGTVIKVKKDGDYYWKEVVAPSGYKVNPNVTNFSTVGYSASNVPTITDEANPTGSLTLNKKLYAVGSRTNGGESQSFTFNVTLVAPVGTDWSSYTLSCTGSTITNNSISGLTRTFSVSVPATGTDVVIGNIPSGTAYSVTETAPDANYTSTPVYIYKNSDTAHNPDDISGTIPSNASSAENNVRYDVTNKREVGSLTLAKTVMGDYTTAGITKGTTEFTYTVILTHPDNVDLRDYLTWSSFDGIGATVTKINGSDFTSNTESAYNAITDTLESIEFTVAVKCDNGSKTIGNLPMGTMYKVTEINANATGTGWTCKTTGEVSSDTSLTIAQPNPLVTIVNNYTETITPPTPTGPDIILTKTAKEQVGNYDIGAPLPDAKFLLYNADGGTLAGTFNQALDSGSNPISGEYVYQSSGGAYNTNASDSSKYMSTGNVFSDSTHYGKLILKGLPKGDYYFEEKTAPEGFVATDSNDNGNAKKVYFSVGSNTTTKYLTCSDEMSPAYIKLYEHINEKLPAWGDPTFIFKITQTGCYKNDGTNNIQTISNGKTMLVALTVDDDGKLTTDAILGNTYNNWYQESTDELEGESPQKREYQGMYHIDSEGKIRLEPGTYSITRIPVSRYEFVADTWAIDSTNPTFTANTTDAGKATGLESAVSVTVNRGETALVHYYDKVAYYDKFSHVDTKINQFYKLDSKKKNTTVKGIRIKDIKNVTTASDTSIDISSDSTNFKMYFIYVDGTESEITDTTERQKLTISYNGADTAFGNSSTGFEFTNNTIKIKSNNAFKDKVYPLKAEYKENNEVIFSTTFDIVFERSS